METVLLSGWQIGLPEGRNNSHGREGSSGLKRHDLECEWLTRENHGFGVSFIHLVHPSILSTLPYLSLFCRLVYALLRFLLHAVIVLIDVFPNLSVFFERSVCFLAFRSRLCSCYLVLVIQSRGMPEYSS